MALIKLYESPEYKEQVHDYEKHEDLFKGDNKTLTSPTYLPYHELERDTSVTGAVDIRKTRESLSRYTNFPARAFRRYKSIIFQQDPEVDEETIKFLEDNELLNNIDGKGTSFFNFIKDKLFKSKFIYGDSYLLTTSEDGAPIWEAVNPLAAKDYSIKTGKLILFRYEYQVIEPRTTSREQPKPMMYSDEYYIKDNRVNLSRFKQEVSKDKKQSSSWELISDEVVTGFDELPVVFNNGDSFIKDPANDVLEYHNLKSALMNQLYHQAFDRIMISGDVDDKQAFALSAFTVTIIRTKDGTPASITNIPGADTSSVRDQMLEAAQNVFKSFYHYNRAIAGDSGNIESAESQELAKEDLLNVIRAEIEDLERQVNQGLKHLATQVGIRNFTGEVKFNKNISISNVEQELREELAYLNIAAGVSPKWEKALYKKAVKRQELENEEDILDEIEKAEKEVTEPTLDIEI